MKIFKMRVLPILFSLFILVSCLPLVCAAEDGAAISVSSASGKAGDEVTVNVNLTENPGVVAMNLNVAYDAKQLELVSASNAGVLNGFSSPTPSGNSGSYTLNWEDGLAASNNNGTGTVATLTFRLKEDCDSAAVNVSGVGHNFDVQPVAVSGGKGTITNTNPTTTTTKPTTTKPTTTKPTTTKPATTKSSTTKPSSTKATTRPYSTSAYTRSFNEANTYPVDFEVSTEPESITDFTTDWEETTEWTLPTFTEAKTEEETTAAEQENGSKVSNVRMILIVLIACFAIIGIAVIISMISKSKR